MSKTQLLMYNYKIQRGNFGFVSEFFTDGFSTILYERKYEAFSAKKFSDLQVGANMK